MYLFLRLGTFICYLLFGTLFCLPYSFTVVRQCLIQKDLRFRRNISLEMTSRGARVSMSTSHSSSIVNYVHLYICVLCMHAR
jgi:hypothetical protein